MKALFCFLMLAVSVSAWAADTASEEAEIFYAAKENFRKDAHWELRAGAGYDYSNSFLSIFAFQGGALWLIDSTFSLGVEGAIYEASKKGSAASMAEVLNTTHSANTFAIAPQAKAVGVFRLTPLSGMVNLFSEHIIKVDMSLLLRAGTIKYQTAGWGPNVGTGLETLFGISPTFGVSLAFHLEYERPVGNDWIHRTGIMLGPTFRF